MTHIKVRLFKDEPRVAETVNAEILIQEGREIQGRHEDTPFIQVRLDNVPLHPDYQLNDKITVVPDDKVDLWKPCEVSFEYSGHKWDEKIGKYYGDLNSLDVVREVHKEELEA